MADDRRAEWVCTGCGVRVYKPGMKMPIPRGWEPESGRCLRCTQEDEEPEERAKRLLLDGASVQKTAKLSPSLKSKDVDKLRKGLVKAGELAPDATPDPKSEELKPKPKPKEAPKPRKGKKSELASRIEAELRADPSRSNLEIAGTVGASASAVRVRRKKMGLPPPKLDRHGKPVP